MMSAGVVINHIMVQIRDYIKADTAAEVKAVLNMNLCEYTFRKNENPTELSTDTDVTYEILLNYRDQLIIEGKAAATIENYGRELKKLLVWTGLPVKEIKERHINSYMAHGRIQRKWKDKTYNSKIRSLRAFFRWAYEYDVIPEDPMRRIKEIKEEFRMGSILSPEHREIMRCACRTSRELALVDLLYSSGGRISEICRLDRDGIDFSNRRMIIFGKGKKEREIYFSPQAKVHMTDYLESRTDSSPALFVCARAPYRRLSDDGVRYILKQIQARDGRLAGLQISPHTFRRTCGTDMINRGAPAEMVQKKLGHENINTTLTCYAKISTAAVRDAERRYGAA